MAYQFVTVLWKDAWIDATEPMTIEDVDVKHRPLMVKTFGWLLKESEVGVTLASERYLDDSEHDVFRTATFIPRAMIQSITPVILTKKRTKKAPPPSNNVS